MRTFLREAAATILDLCFLASLAAVIVYFLALIGFGARSFISWFLGA